MATKILPPLPWKLQASYKLRRLLVGIVLCACGAAALVGTTLVQVAALREVGRDERIWNNPTSQSSIADVSGTDRSHFFIHTYKLAVTYDTPTGVRTRPLELGSIGAIDRSAAAEVRYDPANPDHFALNWAANAHAARRYSEIALLIFSYLAICGSLGLIGALALVRWRQALAIERRGVELHCKVVLADGDPLFYRIEAPTKAEDPESPFLVAETGGFHWRKGEANVLLIDGKVVALIDAAATGLNGNVLALRDDLWPLELDDEARRAILEPAHVGKGQTAGG